ncbi:TPA: DEAD/DEAH box helicase family protein [Legionella pneumophila]|uniref:DEAD/DEAH box helicase n=1 Tax=Legionella pneumophila TaxID=446 RepID=UPI001A1AF564|nr:DEAD/DEAH box helicase family protein [Legionella pneumophila]HAT1994249.1 DEAD/DEAH box helicase family protein [Legionella pneumophila]HAT2051896.1 DEAD/DEAH box helicase family protein [Legionella pneumophila]HAT2061298.1 DEAD/DEAH box helicase family protein [Legionella pneumophila]HAT4435666.1 DEAD/DEAH box helicase family protein [Legionella pneumophila]
MSKLDLSEFGDKLLKKNIKSVEIAYLANEKLNNEQLDTNLFLRITKSWRGCLTVVPIDAVIAENKECLRQPQISALFAILAHCTSHKTGDATVVMPTGTGKTETMLASICSLPVGRALIIVPTVSLRHQTFKKFLCLGYLRKLHAIQTETLNPITALLDGRVSTQEELDLALTANVIVTTPQSLSRTEPQFRNELFKQCSHLFVDEAHHIKAKTWELIKQKFLDKPVIQFTATPFREDRKKIDGVFIYNYPISVAQKQGFFKPINFKSIYEVHEEKADEKIANEAVSSLSRDLSEGFNHILMARCNTKQKADKVFKIYQENYAHLNPILIHSSVPQREKKLQAIIRKEHRIVVCVNMLGEGFDLPELKICALHDIHKSLAITLQFAGRFIRGRDDLGDATFIANICDQNVDDALKDLYREDPNWNLVLKHISESRIQHEVEMQRMENSANKMGVDIPIENISMALSTVVYEIDSVTFNEKTLFALDNHEELISKITFPDSNLVVLITKIEIQTKWSPQGNFTVPEWRLIVLYLTPDNNILFIHDSSKSGTRQKLAKSISTKAKILKGDNVFKCFGDIERLTLQNAGLNRGRRGPLRYVMYTGIDIESAINELAQGASYKSNLFGKGYYKGSKVSLGCSYKGRIWSMKSTSIVNWMMWCDDIGRKLKDPEIDPNSILDKVLRTKEITIFPVGLVPIAIDWPDYYYRNGDLSEINLVIEEEKFTLDDAEIKLISHTLDSIEFLIQFNAHEVKYKYTLENDTHVVRKISKESIYVIKSDFEQIALHDEFSQNCSPVVYFSDGSKLFDNFHIVRPDGYLIPQIANDCLIKYEWSIDIRRESQGSTKNTNTIQYALLNELKQKKYWFIFNDDGAGEIADIVAFKDENELLSIEFYHLKFSQKSSTGSRIGDFYEVCGQVIKNCKWVGEFDNIIKHLKARERKRINNNQTSRIEQGEYRDLDHLKIHGGRLEKEYKVFIVQPGLNISNISNDIASLLGATDLYVKETTGKNLTVIAS